MSTPSTWKTVKGTNQPPNSVAFNNMLLLTDGSVLLQNTNNVDWYRLTPDPTSGTYENGSWAGPFNMTQSRLYYASGVLPDGRIFVVGGEDSQSGAGVYVKTGEIFDPSTNKWSAMTKPSPTLDYINGDASSCVLADGRVLFGATGANTSNGGNRTAIWDPLAETWFESGLGFGTQTTNSKVGNCNEETWTLLPDGTVLTVDIVDPFGNAITNSAEKYNPTTDLWEPAGSPVSSLPEFSLPNTPAGSTLSPLQNEIGPALVLPNGTVFFLGADGNSGVYVIPSDPTQPGTWNAGPTLPTDTSGNNYNQTSTSNLQTILDGPGCILPTGQVLFVGGNTAQNSPSYSSLATGYYIYDYTQTNIANQISLLDTQPPTKGTWSYDVIFLLLPTGQVLCSTQSNTLQTLTVGSTYGTINDAWRPSLTGIPDTMVVGHSYTLSGHQINGISQGSSYGDDTQNATNYPIVQMTTTSSAEIRYLPTFNFSYFGISAVGDTSVQSFSAQVPNDFPPGSWNLSVVTNGISSDPFPVEILGTDLLIVTNSNTYSRGQIQSLENNANGGPANINPALSVIVEGLTAGDLQLTTANLDSPPVFPTFSAPAQGITISLSPTVPLQPEDPSVPASEIQRFTFNYEISFTGTGMFDNWVGSPPTLNVPITASLSLSNAPPPATGNLVLTQNPNPFILHGADIDIPSGPTYPFYLSVDIKVFQLLAGQTMFAVPQLGSATDTTINPDAALSWIQGALSTLNMPANSAGALQDFNNLPADQDVSALQLASTDTATGRAVYNFALARVRLQDLTGQTAKNVRVFFRMFPGARMDATYNASTLYRVANNGTAPISVLGVVGDEITTIPFFATKRVDASTVSMDTQTDTYNVQQAISASSIGAEVDTYYGAWLDINTDTPYYPTAIINSTGATGTDWINGPYTNMGPLVSVKQLIRSQHQCLLAEINYDLDPVVANSDPSNSDKLAQRNLSIIGVPNPGLVPSRVAPQVFEIRPTPNLLAAASKHDELVIDWGGVPSGSTGSIYAPGTTAAQILALASQMYTTHRLQSTDAYTISCPAEGLTYIPVPTGTSPQNFAALLSVELPLGIKAGQSFTVVVKQITSASATYIPPPQQPPPPPVPQIARSNQKVIASQDESQTKEIIKWRRILGVFALTLPISTKVALLEDEERLLSILLYIQLSIPVTSRWWPVFARYVSSVAGRVGAMGGDPITILPDPDGNGRVGKCADEIELCGKVIRLDFDCGGCFEGFEFVVHEKKKKKLGGGAGGGGGGHQKHWFHAREREMERLLSRCCREGLEVVVTVLKKDRKCVKGIKVYEREREREGCHCCCCGGGHRRGGNHKHEHDGEGEDCDHGHEKGHGHEKDHGKGHPPHHHDHDCGHEHEHEQGHCE